VQHQQARFVRPPTHAFHHEARCGERRIVHRIAGEHAAEVALEGLGGEWPEALASRAQALRRDADEGLRSACRRLCGTDDAAAQRGLRFAVVDVPLAAVLPHLRAGEVPPPLLDGLVIATARAALATLPAPRRRRRGARGA